MFHLFGKYLAERKLLVIFVLYYLTAAILSLTHTVDIFPPCLYKWLTGKPCLTCGITRASLCFLRGQWGRAFHYHPLVFLLFPGFFLWLIRDVQQFLSNSKNHPTV